MSYFLPHIAAMEGYVPGEQPADEGFVKLNTNENPYPPSPAVVERLQSACLDSLRLYPDPEAEGVRRRLASLLELDISQTMIGNGSDELLSIVEQNDGKNSGAVRVSLGMVTNFADV